MRTQNIYQQGKEEQTPEGSIKMSIDTNSIDYLMHNLTNLYSDPVSAVVREYVSNAYDSHVRAGNLSTPIETSFDPHTNIFTVEDFGVGMSKQEIIDVYSKYGLSTKNNTNSEIGAFGLGAKSALAITDRFDITARKNGMETVAYVEKNSKGVGVFHFVSETVTDKPNGFTVKVQTSRLNTYLKDILSNTWQPAHELFLPYKQEEIIFNNKTLPSISEPLWETVEQDGEVLGWVAYTVPALNPEYKPQEHVTPESNLYYNVGKVLYTSDSPVTKNWRNRYRAYSPRLIINLPIGSVDLTPSRESLMGTQKTEETLNAATVNFLNRLNIMLSEKLSEKEGDEFLEYFSAIANAFSRDVKELSTYNYRGETINTTADYDITGVLGRIVSKASQSADVKITNFTDVNQFKMFHSKDNSIIIVDSEQNITPALVQTAKEAFYYVNSFNKTSYKNKAEVWMFFEDKTSQVLPEQVKRLKKIYTVEEFLAIVKTRRSEVRKEAAANRNMKGSQKPAPTGDITLPATVVEEGKTVIFRKKVFTMGDIPAKKTAYISANTPSRLSQLVPVLGWRYNNDFGVELARPFGTLNKNLSTILTEALNGWDLVIIPPRRLLKNVEKFFHELVPAETVIEKYITEQLNITADEILEAAVIRLFPKNSQTHVLLNKTHILNTILSGTETKIRNKETKQFVENITKINTFIEKEDKIFTTIVQAEAWKMLPENITSGAEKWETQLSTFYKKYAMLEAITTQHYYEEFTYGETLNHVPQYINMVDSAEKEN